MTHPKSLLLLIALSLLAGSCALQDPVADESREPAPETESAEPEPEESAETQGEAPTGADDDGLELLDPSNVAEMPSDEDMRPTVGPERRDPLIATPPEQPSSND